MANPPGGFGKMTVFEDFLGIGHHNGAWTETGILEIGQLSFTSVNEGSLAQTVDEPGGILAITTDTADDDNACLYAGPFKAADGGCVMEARFKVADITTVSVNCGFTETLSATTPVMPMEWSAATTASYAVAGGIVCANFDCDTTTDLWRAFFGDASTVSGGGDLNGTSSGKAAVNDEWDVVRVEVDPDGKARVYHDGVLIKASSTAAVTTTDVLHAFLMVENRSGAANTLEVDYFFAEGFRDWTV